MADAGHGDLAFQAHELGLPGNGDLDVGLRKNRDDIARLKFEIEIIEKMGFPGYFLVVADFIGSPAMNLFEGTFDMEGEPVNTLAPPVSAEFEALMTKVASDQAARSLDQFFCLLSVSSRM